ncbi:MAG: MurR/RpiR family transcriptional regulator, partial [Atribacterota bacterium]
MPHNKLPLIIKIRSNYSSYTPSLKKIADYLMENFSDFIHMTINEVARVCQVSESSLTRFSQKVGMKNFQALKIQLAHEMGAMTEDETVYGEILFQDDIGTIVQKVFQAHQEVSNNTNRQLNKNDLAQVVDKIIQANKILIYTAGGSNVAGISFYLRLVRLDLPCFLYMDSTTQLVSASFASPKDVVIAISNSGNIQHLNQAAREAKKNRAFIVAITSYQSSPLAHFADTIIYTTACEDSPFFGEATVSRVAQLLVT